MSDVYRRNPMWDVYRRNPMWDLYRGNLMWDLYRRRPIRGLYRENDQWRPYTGGTLSQPQWRMYTGRSFGHGLIEEKQSLPYQPISLVTALYRGNSGGLSIQGEQRWSMYTGGNNKAAETNHSLRLGK